MCQTLLSKKKRNLASDYATGVADHSPAGTHAWKIAKQHVHPYKESCPQMRGPSDSLAPNQGILKPEPPRPSASSAPIQNKLILIHLKYREPECQELLSTCPGVIHEKQLLVFVVWVVKSLKVNSYTINLELLWIRGQRTYFSYDTSHKPFVTC